METTIMGYIGTTRRIHSFIPSSPKAALATNMRLLGSPVGKDGRDPFRLAKVAYSTLLRSLSANPKPYTPKL